MHTVHMIVLPQNTKREDIEELVKKRLDPYKGKRYSIGLDKEKGWWEIFDILLVKEWLEKPAFQKWNHYKKAKQWYSYQMSTIGNSLQLPDKPWRERKYGTSSAEDRELQKKWFHKTIPLLEQYKENYIVFVSLHR